MSDLFTCGNCKHEHSINDLELWKVYDSDGEETEFTCTECDAELIITSIVTGWEFDVIVND